MFTAFLLSLLGSVCFLLAFQLESIEHNRLNYEYWDFYHDVCRVHCKLLQAQDKGIAPIRPIVRALDRALAL